MRKNEKNGVTKTDLTPLAKILEKYGKERGNLIKILQETQNTYGYLPAEALVFISTATKIPTSRIYGVVTFYAQFRLKPIGKYLLMVCHGTACHVNGADRISAALEGELGIVSGETTEDKLFTLENVACLGCCSMAPVMMVRCRDKSEVYGPLTPQSAVKILRNLKKEEGGEMA